MRERVERWCVFQDDSLHADYGTSDEAFRHVRYMDAASQHDGTPIPNARVLRLVELRPTETIVALDDEGLLDTARLDWLERASADALEIDNYGAGVGEPHEWDRVFLTWVADRKRIASATSLRAAIDLAALKETPNDQLTGDLMREIYRVALSHENNLISLARDAIIRGVGLQYDRPCLWVEAPKEPQPMVPHRMIVLNDFGIVPPEAVYLGTAARSSTSHHVYEVPA